MTTARRRTELASLLAEGAAHEARGRLDDAAAAYQRALALDARDPEAPTRLGLLEARRGAPWRAVPWLERALRAAPRAASRHCDLALLHLHLERPDLALPLAQAAARLEPAAVEPLRIVGRCLHALGRAAAAQAALRRALELAPGDAALTLELAQALDMGGEPAAALAIYRELIAAGSRDVHAFDGFARGARHRDAPPELDRIAALLADPATPAADRPWLQRAAGRILDDLGRHDEAFASFAAAKTPARGVAHAAAFAARVALARELITPAALARWRGAGSPVERPIFVFGMPRSGTTLVEQILASHPAVHGANELGFFRDAARRHGLDAAAREPLVAALAAFGRAELQALGRDYLKLLAAHSDQAARVVDKMPLNFEVLWLLAVAFPRATFVHCRRDPLATCVSCYTEPLGPAHAYAEDLGALGSYHRSYQALMAHWRAALPVRMLEVDYEALVADQEGETRRLIDHAGLPWHDGCLRFHELKRGVRTPSRRQVERPIYRTALDAWRRHERHLAPLQAALAAPPGADPRRP